MKIDYSYFRYGSILLFLSVVISCSKDPKLPNLASTNDLLSFSFKKEKQSSLWDDIEGEIEGDTIFAHTLVGTDVSSLIPVFKHNGVKVTVDGVEQKSDTSNQDFRKLVKYTVVAENGQGKAYFVKIKDTGLPAVYLSTNGQEIHSKEEYIKASIKITQGFQGEVIYEGLTEVKGRGNSTWGMPKKPYRLKLDKKADLLGMPSDKSWALMANYGDQSLMRNEIAFEVSRRLELEYTPSQKYVEFFLNGEYMGNYNLTEHVKEGSQRIPIEEKNGGFIIEGDGYAFQEPVHFQTPKGMPLTVKFPDEDEITPEQLAYIRNYYTTFENSLFKIGNQSNTDFQQYFDLESFVKYYLINEICGNSDMVWSMRMYKKSAQDPKIYVGPVWDFDLAFNADKRLGDTEKKLMLLNAHEPRVWMNRLKEEPAFKKLVREKWNAIKSNIMTLPDYIDQRSDHIKYSHIPNFIRWEVLGVDINQSWYKGQTHADYINFIKDYLTMRIAWLDTTFNGEQFD